MLWTVRIMVLKATLINALFLESTFVSLLNFWLKTWKLDKTLAMLCNQSYIEQLVAFSATLSNKKVGRLVTKGGGLGPDNKKWVGSDQERVGSDNLRSEICVEYFVSLAFFRQVYEKKGITKIQYVVFFLSNWGEDQYKGLLQNSIAFFRKYSSITTTLSGLGPTWANPTKIGKKARATLDGSTGCIGWNFKRSTVYDYFLVLRLIFCSKFWQVQY